MRRGRSHEPSFLGNPVLIGALTTLVVIVAVLLAYNANTGLPFVPSYYLHVEFNNASELQKGDDVNMGGALIGLVRSVTATRTRTGAAVADVDLKLYKNVDPLPVDSRFTVRLKGAIGLKYLDVSLGRSRQGWRSGATVPISHTGTSVDFDQVLNMFTPPTARGIQQSTIGFGEATAGRGYDINNAIGAFLPLVDNLEPVASNLASSNTNLAGFFKGLESYSSALAPVAQTQATLFANLDKTFAALAGVAPSLQNTISLTPPAFEATITQSPVIRPFLTDTASLFKQLIPGVRTLKTSAPVLTQAFAVGVRNLPGTAGLDTRLVSFSKTLQSYGETPSVQQGLDRLTQLSTSLKSPLAFLAPVQASCNYVTVFLGNTASVLSQQASDGGFLRFSPVVIRYAQGSEVTPSQKPYSGPVAANSNPSGDIGDLHANPYPNTGSPGEVQECSAGKEPDSDPAQVLIGNPAGDFGLGTEKTTRSTSVK